MASIPCLAYSRRNDEDKQAENFDKEADYPAKESAEIPAKETTEKLTEPTGTTEGPASSSKMCPINNVDAKMIRADKNLLESQKLRDYIRLKFDYEEVQGKVCSRIIKKIILQKLFKQPTLKHDIKVINVLTLLPALVLKRKYIFRGKL
jgi:hypothetical protein